MRYIMIVQNQQTSSWSISLELDRRPVLPRAREGISPSLYASRFLRKHERIPEGFDETARRARALGALKVESNELSGPVNA